jgi:hypothetical protein
MTRAGLLVVAVVSVAAAQPAGPAPAVSPASATRAVSAVVTAATTATRTPQQAVNAGAAYSAARGITSYLAVLDRKTGKVLARTGNAGTQVASESIVKLMIAAYYRVHYGSSMSATMSARLTQMIRCSDDGIASAYWTNSAVPEMAARYGLTHTSNNPGNPGYWGKTRITADDMARLVYRIGKDQLVGPWLMPAMVQATDNGCDGFNQNFGFNAIAGAGSKQGWGGDNWTSQPNAIHSVGFTGKYMVAVLQTGNPGTYATMPATATYTAKLIAGSSANVSRYPTYPKVQADKFTSALYRQLLARKVTSPVQSVALQQGSRSKKQVADDLSTTGARRGRLTNVVYQECLGHNADATGLRVWTARLATRNIKDLYMAVCGSPSAYARAGKNLRTWTAATFRAVLRQSPTAAQLDHWTAVARSRGLPKTVDALTGTAPFREQWIDRLYRTMLGRPANAATYAAVKDNIRGRGIFSVTSYLAVSTEYWHRWVG